MTMSVPTPTTLDDSKVDHLLLLIGSNPIPNAVAASLLLNPSGCAYLLFSAATRSIAGYLRHWLTARWHQAGRGMTAVLLDDAVNEVDPSSVENAVRQWAVGRNGSIGLHYTGGTKVMAVHADRALAATLGPMAYRTSYLDPQRGYLYIDTLYPEGGDLDLVIPTGGMVALSLEHIAALHGVNLVPGGHRVPPGRPDLQRVWDGLRAGGARDGDIQFNVDVQIGERVVNRRAFDVLAVIGYQIFAFTLPRHGDRADLKLALFACIERAVRLGGDEARAALICPPGALDPRSIERDVLSIFNFQARVQGVQPYKVFAANDPILPWIQKEIRPHV